VSKLRIYKESLTALPAVKLRVYKASLTAGAVPKVRVYKASLTAVAAVVITPPGNRTVGPGEDVELTSTLVTAGSPTWSWRTISGHDVDMDTVGGVATFVTPSLWNDEEDQPTSGVPDVATVEIGVKATVGGVESLEAVSVVTVLPQTTWSRNGSTWVGARHAPA
jgi:hypothetical protein